MTHYSNGSTLWLTMRASIVDETKTVTRTIRCKIEWLRPEAEHLPEPYAL